MFRALSGTRASSVTTLLVAGLLVASTSTADSQGVTGASVAGRVVTSTEEPVPGAIVTLVNTSTGAVRRTVVGARGVFVFENVPVGGPYRLEARSMGSELASIDPIVLGLGDRVVRQLVLGDRAQTIETVVVSGGNLRDSGSGGPTYSISAAEIEAVPLLDRDFVGLLSLAPELTGVSSGSFSVSGQHSRFNAIQIDGASTNDFFGVNATPGASSGAKAISIEALAELRVLVAPFDVRQGGFSGALVNAVTRSGTNTLEGSVFSSLGRSSLVGPDTAGARVADFGSVQYGFRVGGPIIPNKLHFFAVADIQSRRSTFVGPAAVEPSTGISVATAERASQILRDNYGIDAGGPDSPILRQPNQNLFLKLSWQPGVNESIEITHTRVNARTDVFNRTIRTRIDRDGWQLSNSGSVSGARNVVTRARFISAFGAVSNEMIASFGAMDDRIDSNIDTPLFLVQGDLLNTYLAGGSVKGAQGTDTRQRVVELTDNLSWTAGRHLLTLGTENQIVRVRDNFFLGSWGVWTFGSVDALALGQPSRYEVALPLRPGGPLASYTATLLSGYLQDRWTVNDRTTLTLGLRFDQPFFGAPARNPTLASDGSLGNIDTSRFPSGNGVVSPRMGFAFDLGDDHTTMFRGGIGAFAGRPPLAWLTGAYSNTGLEQTLLVCNPADGVPAPTADVNQLPTRCVSAPPNSSAVPSITYFARNFRFPQAIKFVAGLDHDFGDGLFGSIDFVHTRTRNNLVVNDVNLLETGTNAEGRVMYGTITATGVSRPTRADSTSFGRVFRYENRTADRSSALTAVVRKSWGAKREIQIGYNWSRASDLMNLAGFNGLLMFQNNPIDGSIANRRLGRSARDIPHSLIATAIVPAGFGLTASLFFRARSGTPYAPVASGDANADGTSSNDLAYIPRDSTDISLRNPGAYAGLDRFIESEPCLRQQRGRIVHRNSCRNPAVRSLDARIARAWAIRGARGVEISADFFNVGNILNPKWGLARETSSREELGLIAITGWDAAANRPFYTIPTLNGQPVLPARNVIVTEVSRWRMQLGARYNF
jgi:hypothetical protein